MFLDTCFCVDLLRERVRRTPGPATAKLAALGETPLFMPVFVLCELHAGARRAADPRRGLRLVESLAEHVQVAYPQAGFADAYGEAEAWLRARGTPVPTMDLLIGVLAKAHDRPLLTRDAEHFRRLPGLTVEMY